MYTFSIASITLSLLSLYTTTTTALPIPKPNPNPNSKWPMSVSWPTEPTANPVLPDDFPDPSFIYAPESDAYYAFATSSIPRNINIQIATTPSFTNPSWQLLAQDALPNPGPWTDGTPNIWAPNVLKTTSGTYVLYYAARPKQDVSKHCIGTATSKSITGPYTPSASPFTCDLTVGGSIDPSHFIDPATNRTYITYKIDGNSLGNGHPTPIMLQEVSPSDGITQLGVPTQIFSQDPNANVDGPLVEAPTLISQDGRYFLLFSTHMYNTAAYDTRYVSADSVYGPFEMTQNVLLKTADGNGVVAPGSGDVHDGLMVFHGTVMPPPSLNRAMYAGYVRVQGGSLVFEGI